MRGERSRAVSVDDNITESHPYAEFDTVILRFGRLLSQFVMPLDRTARRIADVRELHEQPVASGFDDAAVVFGNLGVGKLCAQRLEACQPYASKTISGLLIYCDELGEHSVHEARSDERGDRTRRRDPCPDTTACAGST